MTTNTPPLTPVQEARRDEALAWMRLLGADLDHYEGIAHTLSADYGRPNALASSEYARALKAAADRAEAAERGCRSLRAELEQARAERDEARKALALKDLPDVTMREELRTAMLCEQDAQIAALRAERAAAHAATDRAEAELAQERRRLTQAHADYWRAIDALKEPERTATAEANEKGAGGDHLARIADARAVLAPTDNALRERDALRAAHEAALLQVAERDAAAARNAANTTATIGAACEALVRERDAARASEARLREALTACRRQMQNDWHNKPRIGTERECALADAALSSTDTRWLDEQKAEAVAKFVREQERSVADALLARVSAEARRVALIEIGNAVETMTDAQLTAARRLLTVKLNDVRRDELRAIGTWIRAHALVSAPAAAGREGVGSLRTCALHTDCHAADERARILGHQSDHHCAGLGCECHGARR